MDEEPAPPSRSSWFTALLVILAIGGSAVGVLIYQYMQSGRKTTVDTSGFDIAQTTDNNKTFAATQTQTPQQDQSSLGMVKTGLPQLRFGSNVGGAPPASGSSAPSGDANKQAADAFSILCVRNEAKVRAVAQKWTKESPTLQKYGKEWMSYPDLKQLNDNYMRYHDPIAFMRGLAHSDNFPKLVKNYAGDPQMQQYAKDAMKLIPPELFNAGLNYANKDDIVKSLVGNVMQSLGLPPGILGASPGQSQVDAGKVMGSMLSNNPQLQKAMDSNPEIQQKIKDATQTPAGQQPH